MGYIGQLYLRNTMVDIEVFSHCSVERKIHVTRLHPEILAPDAVLTADSDASQQVGQALNDGGLNQLAAVVCLIKRQTVGLDRRVGRIN